MQLSRNFNLNEFLISQTAYRHGIKEQFTPPDEVISNLNYLCDYILQPLREKAGALRITSGYRCKRLNDLINGSATSQHMTGQAADIQAINISNKELFDLIKKMNLPYWQLIWEFGSKYEPAWVHVSYSPGKPPRKQILYIGV